MVKPLKVILFKSRNKDNKHIDGFKERSKSFLSNRSYESLQKAFNQYVNEGLDGEHVRFYQSVNIRSNTAVRKALLHELIDNDTLSMADIDIKAASLAAKTQNRDESKWLFDFDKENHRIDEFLEDLYSYIDKTSVHVYKTPNHFAVITDHGFDTRKLLAKWENVTLMRDDMLCVDWKKK